MDQREPPYLQFGFYFDTLTGDESIVAIYEGLLSTGKPFQVGIQALKGKGQRWMEPFEPWSIEYIDADADHIRRLQHDNMVRIASIEMECTRLHASRRILLAQRRGTDSPETRSHPVEIIIDANDICGTPEISKAKLPTDLNRLEWLLDRLSPTYVTINVEYPTTSPSELKGRRTAYDGFRDCYLTRELAARVMPAIISLMPLHGCTKTLKNGVLCCSSGTFVPTGCTRFTPDASVEAKVSNMVAAHVVDFYCGVSVSNERIPSISRGRDQSENHENLK